MVKIMKFFTQIEQEVFSYMYIINENKNLMDNSEIAKAIGITETYLLDVLKSINSKINNSDCSFLD